MVQEDRVKKANVFLDIIRGLVRPFIAVSLTCTLIYLFINGETELIKTLLIILGPIVGFYYGDRKAEKERLNI